MWTEEKIQAVLERKENLLKELQTTVQDNGTWFKAFKFMDDDGYNVAVVATELWHQREQLKKIEIQIEVLKCVLDIK